MLILAKPSKQAYGKIQILFFNPVPFIFSFHYEFYNLDLKNYKFCSRMYAESEKEVNIFCSLVSSRYILFPYNPHILSPFRLMVNYAQTIKNLVFHHKINLVRNIIKFLSLAGHENCMIGKRDGVGPVDNRPSPG